VGERLATEHGGLLSAGVDAPRTNGDLADRHRPAVARAGRVLEAPATGTQPKPWFSDRMMSPSGW
jgi:hypothetical protein